MITQVTHSIIWVQGKHLELRRQGWLLMEATKRESVQWTKSFTRFSLLMFSLILSMAFLIWSISSSKCGTFREAVSLDWFSCSVFSPFLTSWLWACPSTYLSWHYLLRVISLVNSWFWWVNSVMQTTPTDDAKKINRLNASGFNELVIVEEAWKGKDTRSKVTGMNRPRTLRYLS